RSLARQRGKAERYGKMTEERFAIALTLVRRELEDFDLALGGLGQRAEQLTAALPAERAKLADAEQAREAEVQARHTAEARRTDVERRVNEARLEIGRLEGDLALAAERLRNAGQRRATAGRRREQEAGRAPRPSGRRRPQWARGLSRPRPSSWRRPRRRSSWSGRGARWRTSRSGRHTLARRGVRPKRRWHRWRPGATRWRSSSASGWGSPR